MKSIDYLTPFHYSILKFLYLNRPKSFPNGRIMREIEIPIDMKERLNIANQKKEVLIALKALKACGFVTE